MTRSCLALLTLLLLPALAAAAPVPKAIKRPTTPAERLLGTWREAGGVWRVSFAAGGGYRSGERAAGRYTLGPADAKFPFGTLRLEQTTGAFRTITRWWLSELSADTLTYTDDAGREHRFVRVPEAE